MSDAVKLSSQLAKDDELNGLDAIAEDLITNPQAVTLALVWLDVAKITTDVDTGTKVPTVRIRRVEPHGVAEQASAAIRKLAEDATGKRTGRVPLPFDIVDHDEQ